MCKPNAAGFGNPAERLPYLTHLLSLVMCKPNAAGFGNPAERFLYQNIQESKRLKKVNVQVDLQIRLHMHILALLCVSQMLPDSEIRQNVFFIPF